MAGWPAPRAWARSRPVSLSLSNPAEAALSGLSELRENPPRGAWDFFVRAWRPTASWACTLNLIVGGAVVPVAQLALGVPVTPMDWTALASLAGVLGLGAMRTIEKSLDKTI